MVQNEITMKLRKYFNLNDNENKTYQILWDLVKAVLRGKYIPLN